MNGSPTDRMSSLSENKALRMLLALIVVLFKTNINTLFEIINKIEFIFNFINILIKIKWKILY